MDKKSINELRRRLKKTVVPLQKYAAATLTITKIK